MLKKRFALIVVLILAIFLGIGYLFSKIGNQYSGPPVLTVSEEVGDLGTIKADQPQAHIFILKNEGGKALIIERVQASCGCTATMLSDEKLLPGKTTQLEVTFNPKGYEGEVSHSVYIYSNDPELPRKRIAIKATVEPLPAPKIYLSKNYWNLGLLSSGDSSSFSVQIINRGELVLNIENIVLPASVQYQPEITEFPRQLSPEEEIELTFLFNSSGEDTGVYQENIRLVTNDPKHKNVTLQMEGYLKEKEESISIIPLQKFVISEDMEQKVIEAKFLLKNNSGITLKQISITSSQDYITPHIKEISLSPGEEKEITFRIESENLANLGLKEIIKEYIYFNIPVPVEIDFNLP